MPVKKIESRIKNQESSKKTTAAVSLRAVSKQSQKKIAASPSAPRNDEKKVARGALSVPVYSLAGRAAGTMVLPKEIFGKVVNKKLLAQALRVYMTNQKNLTASTKTRGEVRGSTAKIQRQKGTGKARHGSIRAPIFVGGGIVFGPKPRNVRLELPQKMRKAALLSALSAKAGERQILGVSGLEKASGKTKEVVGLLRKIREIKGSALIVTGEKMDNVVRGVRNIPGIDVMPASQINAYEILRHGMLLLTREAISVILEAQSADKRSLRADALRILKKDALASLQHDRKGKTV